MPRSRECDYCGTDIDPGTGTMFVRTDGTTVHFCSSKCEKNADLGREARNLEWTEAGRGGEAGPEEAVADEEVTESEPGEDVEVDGEDVETETDEDVAEEVEESESVDPDDDEAAGSEEVESDEADEADEAEADEAEESDADADSEDAVDDEGESEDEEAEEAEA